MLVWTYAECQTDFFAQDLVMLDLPVRVYNLLRRNGIQNLGQLVAADTNNSLLEIPGLSESNYGEIKDKLTQIWSKLSFNLPDTAPDYAVGLIYWNAGWTSGQETGYRKGLQEGQDRINEVKFYLQNFLKEVK